MIDERGRGNGLHLKGHVHIIVCRDARLYVIEKNE